MYGESFGNVLKNQKLRNEYVKICVLNAEENEEIDFKLIITYCSKVGLTRKKYWNFVSFSLWFKIQKQVHQIKI